MTKKHSTDHRDLEEAFMKEVMTVEKTAKMGQNGAKIANVPQIAPCCWLHRKRTYPKLRRVAGCTQNGELSPKKQKTKKNARKNIPCLPLGRAACNDILPSEKHCYGAQSSGRRHLFSALRKITFFKNPSKSPKNRPKSPKIAFSRGSERFFSKNVSAHNF